MPYTTNRKVIDAVAITTTSAGYVVGDRVIKSLHLIHTSVTSGVATVQVQVSNTGVEDEWVTYNRLVSNNAAGTVMSTINLDAGANKMAFVYFPEGDTFEYVRVVYRRNNSNSTSFTAALQAVAQ